jgi:hypothetical protein
MGDIILTALAASYAFSGQHLHFRLWVKVLTCFNSFYFFSWLAGRLFEQTQIFAHLRQIVELLTEFWGFFKMGFALHRCLGFWRPLILSFFGLLVLLRGLYHRALLGHVFFFFVIVVKHFWLAMVVTTIEEFPSSMLKWVRTFWPLTLIDIWRSRINILRVFILGNYFLPYAVPLLSGSYGVQI